MRRIIARKTEGEKEAMLELAKKFIGKECLIYTYNSQIAGVIQDVTDGGILISDQRSTQVVNLDYVIRLREYPRDKNGKKKAVIWD